MQRHSVRRSRLLGSLLLGLLVSPTPGFAAGKCERLIVTGSPDAPPYLWRDPQDPRHLMGANADLLKQAAGTLGLKVEFLYAGKRSQALEEVRTGRMDLLADAPMNAAQLDALDYIHPAIVQNDIVIWTRRDHDVPLTTLSELHGHGGAISDKTRLTPAFDETARQQLTLERVSGLTPAFQKLALGEVEYVLAGRYAGMVMVQTLGLSSDVVAQPLPLDRPGFYLALSFNSACNDPWLRGQLAKKMTESAASGLAGEVIRHNLDLWKAQLLQPASASASTK
ncbi:transporter substrate-binding domain-containing protein [Pseudomonas alliivorans]|uniref:substrate-binding periplasmic protein n=1 Tax=Pseudomonas alliivorans TaxID=2810613 RepID=UPI00161C881C|nr:transporter substrate-binding domain-containing protein [Pseudomonas alliivorans]MBP0940421.1 transporter substrate-binding domain-containing protein [Pseudomonas alliivorans]MCO5368743.1 transporter substrate-binding domain-containing protein [Pseudomonas alliivorans]MEE4306491.1 transporter substrate-binding domain-containing protein [Pseudomonas alliivorans]MEE4625550.1 transporter substrate-binding domain-containing protein [Pseudomonas alliivorans]MEE4636630.1 transporter substrate-bin